MWIGQGLIATVGLWGDTTLATRIRTGDVVSDLLRPIHPIVTYLATDLGRAGFALLTRFVVPIIVGLIAFDFYLPHRAVDVPAVRVVGGAARSCCASAAATSSTRPRTGCSTAGARRSPGRCSSTLLGGLYFPLRFLPGAGSSRRCGWPRRSRRCCRRRWTSRWNGRRRGGAIGYVGVQLMWLIVIFVAAAAVQRRASASWWPRVADSHRAVSRRRPSRRMAALPDDAAGPGAGSDVATARRSGIELIGSTLATSLDLLTVIVLFRVTKTLGGFDFSAGVPDVARSPSLGFSIADMVGRQHRPAQPAGPLRPARHDAGPAARAAPPDARDRLRAAPVRPGRPGHRRARRSPPGSRTSDWTLAAAVLLVVTPIARRVFFASVFVIGGSVAFWWIDSGEFANGFTYGGRDFTSYPITVYGSVFRRLFAFGLGFAFVAYYPTLTMLGRPDPLGLPGWVGWTSPLVAATMSRHRGGRLADRRPALSEYGVMTCRRSSTRTGCARSSRSPRRPAGSGGSVARSPRSTASISWSSAARCSATSARTAPASRPR